MSEFQDTSKVRHCKRAKRAKQSLIEFAEPVASPPLRLLRHLRCLAMTGETITLAALLAMTMISGCAKQSTDNVITFPKGYFHDKTDQVLGVSEGVGPSAQKTASQEIKDLGRREIKEYDLSDAAPGALIIKAWEALNKKDEKGVLIFTEKCIELYSEKAKQQAAGLAAFADSASADKHVPMNEVGTCYFIQGEFFKFGSEQNKEKAKESYQILIDQYPFTQYWDQRGWWVKPAEIAKDEIRKIDEGYYNK